MSVRSLLLWQWNGYARYHQSRGNLLLHIVVVPVFVLGNVAAGAGIALCAWPLALTGVAATVVSLALQGRGHKTEAVPPEPFTSPLNAVARIFLEQWVTFPRFVLTGGWSANLRAARNRP